MSVGYAKLELTKGNKMTPMEKIDEALRLLSQDKKDGQFAYPRVLGYLMTVATAEQADFVLELAKQKVGK
jgi:hypothetical protein